MKQILRTGGARAARKWAVRPVRQIPTVRAGWPLTQSCYASLRNWRVFRGQLMPLPTVQNSMLAFHDTYLAIAIKITIAMPPTLIDCYKAIEGGSLRMLAAAHAGDWPGVAQIESDCAALIQNLKRQSRQSGQEAALLLPDRQEKQRILQRILGVDAQIRCLVEVGLLVAAGDAMVNPNPKMLH